MRFPLTWVETLEQKQRGIEGGYTYTRVLNTAHRVLHYTMCVCIIYAVQETGEGESNTDIFLVLNISTERAETDKTRFTTQCKEYIGNFNYELAA